MSTFVYVLCLLAIPFFSLATNNVVINEIAWMGTNISANDEWIELYNNTNSDIDLNEWKLFAQDGTPEINLNGKILAKGFFILERTDDTTVSDIPADIIYAGALSNNGEYLQLTDPQDNTLDKVDCSNGWIAGDNKTKQTMERVGDNWQTSKKAGGTPKAENNEKIKFPLKETEQHPQENMEVQPQKIAYPNGIVINEVLPSPKGSDAENEYIEIFNKNDFKVDISEWSLQDIKGAIKTFVFPSNTIIQTLNYLVFYRPQTKITLNNSGDGLKLLKPNTEIADEIYYEKAELGKSFNRIEEIWEWSLNLTPGKENKTEVQLQEIPGVKDFPTHKTEVRLQEKPEVGLQNSQLSNNFFSILLTGLPISLVSGGLILALKRKMKYHKNIKYAP